MPGPVLLAETQSPTYTPTGTSGSATASTTSGGSGTTTTSTGSCGCCSVCGTSGYLSGLFSSPSGLCPGAISNSSPIYLAATVTFTAVSPYTLAGYCLPSGPTFVGDLEAWPADASGCNQLRWITRSASCNGTDFGIYGSGDNSEGAGTMGAGSFTPISPSFTVCGCNSSNGPANSLRLGGDSINPLTKPWSRSAYSCSPSFTVTYSGHVWAVSGTTYTRVATFTMEFVNASAPYAASAPRVNRLSLPCVNMSAVPIDRAGCNCPDRFIYKCEIYGKCRPNSDLGDGIMCCQKCPDYEEA